MSAEKKSSTPETKNFTPRRMNKRPLNNPTPSPTQKSPRLSLSHSPSQPSNMNLQQIKRLHSTPYSNALSFTAKALHVEKKRKTLDPMVHYHRQKILFADTETFLIMHMYSDPEEDENDPKVSENYTNIVTNFRVLKKGHVVIHEKTTVDL